MERTYVSSSMISSIGYDTSNAILEIEFKSDGSVWQYYDVAEITYQEMMQTSHGKYFHANIKNHYREVRIQ